jgi:hypothetical protein
MKKLRLRKKGDAPNHESIKVKMEHKFPDCMDIGVWDDGKDTVMVCFTDYRHKMAEAQKAVELMPADGKWRFRACFVSSMA